MRSARLGLAALMIMAVAAAPVAGQGGAGATSPANGRLEARTAEVASQLRCPVCQGLSIEDSPTELAQQMRDVVRNQLAAGRSEDEVKSYFVERYGEWVLLEPQPRGFNLTVYLAPIAALLFGAVVIVAAVRRWTGPTTTDPARRAAHPHGD
ncbi:MAG: cytochrome c-type biogenesis protein [Longimicrobiales bacterium]